MEYTNDKLSRIFAAYYGADCVQESYRRITGKIIWVTPDFVSVSLGGDKVSSCALNLCKLLLYPLSAISDADCIAIAKIVNEGKCESGCYEEPICKIIGSYADRKEVVVANKFLLTIWFDGNITATGIYVRNLFLPVENIQRIVDYLRRMNYDMGHEEIKSLIIAELAYDKSLLQK